MTDFLIKEQVDFYLKKWEAIEDLYEEYAKSVGLTSISLSILEYLYSQDDGCTQKKLSEYIHLPKQTVNTIIKSFLDQKLVRLKEVPTDRRNKLVTLTQKGLLHARQIVETLWQAELQAMESLTQEQRKLLIKSASDFEDAFKKSIYQALAQK